MTKFSLFVTMSKKSNNQGRAYEFITLITLEQEISKIRPVKVDKNTCYAAALNAWNTLTSDEQEMYKNSAKAGALKIFELEPRIIEDGGDALELLLQPDNRGEEGDVRDILIIRRDITWEVGLSLKHNHFAVKHSRLSSHLDFGNLWYSIPCSKAYWANVKPVFDFLKAKHKEKIKFSELVDKESTVYIPILKAFIDEVNRQYNDNKELPQKMVEYLLGKYDFYKMISIDRLRLTTIQGFNLHGTLNLPGEKKVSEITIPLVALPTRIVRLDFVPGSSNTVELYMDGGWQFTFRIHNAATLVEPSLKFDVQIVGMPTAIITLNCMWS
jgi:hypothetical protein